jgi:glycosyltransferase involved in cell wall biosynthesis
MPAYPFVYFLREEKYNDVDSFIENNRNKLECTIEIISPNDIHRLNNMFDTNYHILVTYGEDSSRYGSMVMSVIPHGRFNSRWIHITDMNNLNQFNYSVNYCFISVVIQDKELTRPHFSIFTTCYNSYDKIYRAFDGVISQTLRDWEWVLLDDSPDDNHFNFLRKFAEKDKRIRLYKRDKNSGNIGNVKNEAIGLCRGKYVLELDHDDIILDELLSDAYRVFESDPEIGFVYSDFANIYENNSNFSYGDFVSKGYAGYYMQKVKKHWYAVLSTANINNVTMTNLVSMPNHPRLWRKKTLLEIGSYSEFLPICDDYEVLLRTICNTKVVKMHKFGYIQFMNEGGNNFSLIRNREINRLGPRFIYPMFYNKYKVQEFMKKNDAHEDERYIVNHSQIWKRGDDWTHKRYNKIVNNDYDKQYCLLGIDTLNNDKIKELYENKRNDFILLDVDNPTDVLIKTLEYMGYDRMKCYSPRDTSHDELESYFLLICRYTSNYEIIKGNNYARKNCDQVDKPVITIITPTYRINNLIKLKDSINFDFVHEWIIVYDGSKIDNIPDVFKNDKNIKIKEYIHTSEGISGNPQRNYALTKVTNEDTLLYYLDDDNLIHPDLYILLETADTKKMYTFDQYNRLKGNNVSVYHIDTAMCLIPYALCKDIRWIKEKYEADGFYIQECYDKTKAHHIYVNKDLCYYNALAT